ncbi:hypothetical protein [Flavobacterium limicola]|uniref:hypothetical protein n=1 Tax=Flavobacterium limicola TaxID=180441 RepID=UPI000EB462CC|nr:hypothetical protein [Flavobacterium limicola]
MKIEIKLVTSRKEIEDGFPLVVEIKRHNKRESKTISLSNKPACAYKKIIFVCFFHVHELLSNVYIVV